jgi:hypothetical protein
MLCSGSSKRLQRIPAIAKNEIGVPKVPLSRHGNSPCPDNGGQHTAFAGLMVPGLSAPLAANAANLSAIALIADSTDF